MEQNTTKLSLVQTCIEKSRLTDDTLNSIVLHTPAVRLFRDQRVADAQNKHTVMVTLQQVVQFIREQYPNHTWVVTLGEITDLMEREIGIERTYPIGKKEIK